MLQNRKYGGGASITREIFGNFFQALDLKNNLVLISLGNLYYSVINEQRR